MGNNNVYKYSWALVMFAVKDGFRDEVSTTKVGPTRFQANVRNKIRYGYGGGLHGKEIRNKMVFGIPPNLVLPEEFHTRVQENGCDPSERIRFSSLFLF